MKNYFLKTVLFIGVCSIIGSVSAQDTIQQWNIGVYDRNWMPPETTMPFWTTHFYKTNGDTLIDNFSYLKLYSGTDSLFNHISYFGGLKNNAGKIYVNRNNSDYLLYDFNLSVNDTAFVYRFLNGSPFLWKVKLNSISDTVINNRKLKKCFVSYSDTSDAFYPIGNDFWIDEVGSEKFGLLNEAIPAQVTGPDKDFYLLCYKENDETVLQEPKLKTCYKETLTNSIYDEQNNQFTIYPSFLTTFSMVSIESKNIISQIQIFNIQGTKVYNTQVGALNFSFDLNFLKNGFYIIQVNNNTFKLLITR